jgi:hypothetical protein
LPGAASEWKWYKGNLHAHTDRSDGRLPPGSVVDWYAGRGYDFLALTDHGRVTRYEPRQHQILMIPGAEITAYDEPAGAFHHLVALMEPQQADSIARLEIGSPQRILNALGEAGATVILAHPYWLGLSSAELGALQGAVGLEIYNNLCEIERNRGYSETQWDELLLRGKRLWGLATDDCHWRTLDAGGGWVMVRAPELSVSAILQAIRTGDFYSTQGPELKGLRFERSQVGGLLPGAFGRVKLECSPCRKIVFYANRWLGSVIEAAEHGEEPLTQGSYTLTGKETYVRAMCVDFAGRRAWSQPVFPDPPPVLRLR